jgi:signal transduction histidine kinase/CheY-like chemotaxis protein
MPDGGIVATYADITQRMQADLALKRVNETLEQRVARRTAELTQVNEELAQAQKIAEEANLGKTRFLAAVGHDILQPLNAARLYCSSLIEKATGGPLGEAAVNIESSLESVETILGAVLDISRLDAGAMKPEEAVFSLDGLLQQIATDFQPMASAKGLRLRIVPSAIRVRTDRNLFRRLIQNLVSNAIKYTRRGTVLVGVRRRGDLVEIQVIDTGIGIEADKLNMVFREFTRLDEGAREAEGLGLGLSIVDRIARVLHLEIRIFSEAGKGTRFSVLMPTATGEVEQPVRREVALSRPFSTLSGLEILCIDNDPRILEGMRLLLEGWGCEVAAWSGMRAFLEARERRSAPDIVLADYHLDGENGLDAIDRLRQIYGADTPAVLVTADRSTEVRAAAEARGVSVINKPVRPAVLRTLLSRVRPLAAE